MPFPVKPNTLKDPLILYSQIWMAHSLLLYMAYASPPEANWREKPIHDSCLFICVILSATIQKSGAQEVVWTFAFLLFLCNAMVFYILTHSNSQWELYS